jgi:hypothetical protein
MLMLLTHTCILQQVLVSYHVAEMAGTLVLSLRINSKVLFDGNWKVPVSLQDADGLPLLDTPFMVMHHEKTQMT